MCKPAVILGEKTSWNWIFGELGDPRQKIHFLDPFDTEIFRCTISAFLKIGTRNLGIVTFLRLCRKVNLLRDSLSSQNSCWDWWWLLWFFQRTAALFRQIRTFPQLFRFCSDLGNPGIRQIVRDSMLTGCWWEGRILMNLCGKNNVRNCDLLQRDFFARVGPS